MFDYVVESVRLRMRIDDVGHVEKKKRLRFAPYMQSYCMLQVHLE